LTSWDFCSSPSIWGAQQIPEELIQKPPRPGSPNGLVNFFLLAQNIWDCYRENLKPIQWLSLYSWHCWHILDPTSYGHSSSIQPRQGDSLGGCGEQWDSQPKKYKSSSLLTAEHGSP
jgi:hypothetical protein